MLPKETRLTIGLIDQVSAPLGDIQKQLNEFSSATAANNVTSVLKQALAPAIEMERALRELKSFGVANNALKEITKTALNFSAEYGYSAVKVVQHAEGIKKAMGDMPADVMANVTRSSATLAVAMKSDAANTTEYLNNLYASYKTQADAMGLDAWTAKIASMTVKAKQLYGAEMAAIGEMVSKTSTQTAQLGVSLEEQFVVFGMLKMHMPNDSITKEYTSFLENAAGAQDKLGVSLVNASGQMLPMAELVQTLSSKFKDLSNAEVKELLDNAGLEQSATLLTHLMSQADQYGDHFKQFEQIKDIEEALGGAKGMVDPWQQLAKGFEAIQIAIGHALLPSMVPLLSALASGSMQLLEWTQLFPNITKYIGYAAMALLTFASINGQVLVVSGFVNQLSASWKLCHKVFVGAGSAWSKVMMLCRTHLSAVSMYMQMYGIQTKLTTAWIWLQTTATNAATFAYAKVSAALSLVSAGLTTAALAAMRFFAALMMNPIVLIFTAVVAAIGAVIYYWDDLKAAFADIAWFGPIEAVFTYFSSLLSNMQTSFKRLVGWIPGFGGDDDIEISSSSVKKASTQLQVQPGGAAKNIANHQASSTVYHVGGIHTTHMNNAQDFATELQFAAG